MQFFLSLAALAGVALAQNAGLGLPTEGQELSPDSDFVVQVQRPVRLEIANPFHRCRYSNELARTL